MCSVRSNPGRGFPNEKIMLLDYFESTFDLFVSNRCYICAVAILVVIITVKKLSARESAKELALPYDIQ